MATELTKSEAYAVADIIDCYLFQMIRDDPDIDNIVWLSDIISAYKKCCLISDYVPMRSTIRKREEGEGDEQA